MDKPFSVIVEDLETTIVNALNDSHVHPIIMQMVLKNILEDVTLAAKQTSAQEKKKYEEAQETNTEE